MTRALLLALIMSVLVAGDAFAASGLQFTQDEVDIWAARAVSGPYKTAGDVNPNSPGDWSRIKSNADSFLTNSGADRWDGGYQGSGCVPRYSEEPINPNKMFKIRDAAFVYLVTGATGYRDEVRDELLNYYAPNGKFDFSDRSRWCLGANSLNDINPGFGIAEAMVRMIGAYDYIRGSLSTADKTIMDAWFWNAGDYFRQLVDQNINDLYSNRESGVLKDPSYMSGALSSYSTKKTHDGGYDIPKIAAWYNNRRAAIVSLVAHVGILLNDESMINSAKMFFKEWMKYGVFPDGTHNEYYRSTTASHEKGFGYSMSTIYHMISIADIMARDGDDSLYTYTTSEGLAQTKGGSKNLLLAIKNICKYLDRTFTRYLQGKGGQESYRMDGREGNSWVSIYDIYFSIANIYYEDDYIKRIYLREEPGTDPYPSNPATSGAWPVWGGTAGTLPGVLFMFGQMEGKVWPYGDIDDGLQPPISPEITSVQRH